MSDLHPLKDLLDFTRDGEWGKGGPGSDLVEMAVIRGTDFASVRRGDISTVPRRFIPEGAADRKALMPGDLLIETAGGTKDQPTGRTVYLSERIFDALPVPVTCASFSRFLRVNRELVNPRYLFWYLQSIYSTGEMLPYHIQHTGVARFQYTDFASQWLVPVPPLDKQAKIAETLSVFDDKIALNRRMNETLEAMARALFKDWFVDFGPTRAKIEGRDPYLAPEMWDLFPDALDDEGKPVGWSDDVLGSFTNLQNGYAFKSKDWRDCGVPVVKIGSVKPAFVDLGQVSFVDEALALEKAKFRLSSGDMLVGLTGYVGETGRVPPTQYTPMLNQRVGRFLPNSGLEPFVFSCVRQPEFKEFAESKSHGSAQANVSTKDLLAYPLLNPGELIIKPFCEIASTLFRNSLANSVQTSSLAQARDLLLPKLMSGEIRVGDTDKIVLEST